MGHIPGALRSARMSATSRIPIWFCFHEFGRLDCKAAYGNAAHGFQAMLGCLLASIRSLFTAVCQTLIVWHLLRVVLSSSFRLHRKCFVVCSFKSLLQVFFIRRIDSSMCHTFGWNILSSGVPVMVLHRSGCHHVSYACLLVQTSVL